MIQLSDIAKALIVLGIKKRPALSDFDEWSESFFASATAPSGGFLSGLSISTGTTTNSGGISPYTGLFQNGVLMQSSATANSGYRWYCGTGIMTFGAKTNKFRCVWRPLALALTTTRIGFHDTVNQLAPVDGAWIDIEAGLVTGKTANNSVSSTTGTSYLLTINTAYTFDVSVNAAGTLVTFSVSNPETGAILWASTLNTNLPPPLSTIRTFGAGLNSTHSGTAAVSLGLLYYIGMGTEKGFESRRR